MLLKPHSDTFFDSKVVKVETPRDSRMKLRKKKFKVELFIEHTFGTFSFNSNFVASFRSQDFRFTQELVS